MDVATVVLTAVSSVVVSAATAYITTRLRMREEAQKWQRDLAVQRAITRSKDPQAAEQMAIPFAIGVIVIHRGDGTRDRYFLAPGDRIVVGRDSTNSIVMTDPAYSRRHLAFEADAVSVAVLDLGSANGVWVNGDRVLGRHVLINDDKVTVNGEQHFTYHSIATAGAA